MADRTIIICPTVLAENTHQYREQIERVAAFATHIHLDFTDGIFTDSKTIDLSQAWWPHTMQASLHIMYQNPTDHLDAIISLNPQLVIVHAEAQGDFKEFADALHQAGIQFGLAILPETPVAKIADHLEFVDYVLVFSGALGHFGGTVNFEMLEKVGQLKKLKADISVGWDGGIGADNAAKLVMGGVDVLNVGGFIQRAEDPQAAYQQIKTSISNLA